MQLVITDSFKDIQEKDILKLEKDLGLTLPPAYRSFLLTHNGGQPTPDTFITKGGEDESRVRMFYGITTKKIYDLKAQNKVFSDRLPAGHIAIGSDDGGNEIVLNVNPRSKVKVLFFFHETEELMPIANTFDAFLDGLYEYPVEPPSEFDRALEEQDLAYFRQRIASEDMTDIIDEFDRPASMTATIHGKLDVLKLLAEHGAPLEGTLFEAASGGYVDVVQYLLTKGCNVDERDESDNDTPLLQAARNGHLEVVKVLINAGADIHAVTASDWNLQDKAHISDNPALKKFVKSLK